MKVIISAGGTGGHIYPAISIINKIKELDKNVNILYIGTTNRMEKDIIPNLGIEYLGIKINGLSKNPIKCIKFVTGLLNGIKICKDSMKKFKPDIVIGVGGYVTTPVILAANSLNIPILIHEQNSVPGKANRFLSKYANTICVSMKNSISYFPKDKTVYTGNPRSEDVLNSKKGNKLDYGLSLNKKLVLITTGSLGASSINEIIVDMLPKLKNKSYEVLLVTGKESYEIIKKQIHSSNVKVVAYIDNMASVLKFTDLIVSRSGATIMSEITALGIPSILIPSPYVANNHQYLNAKELLDNKACVLLEEKDLSSDTLLNSIDKIISNKELYNELSSNTKKIGIKDSATKIYEEIKKIIK